MKPACEPAAQRAHTACKYNCQIHSCCSRLSPKRFQNCTFRNHMFFIKLVDWVDHMVRWPSQAGLSRNACTICMCAVISKAVPADGSVLHWLSLTLVFCSTHGAYPSHINPICPLSVFCYLVFCAHMLSCLQSTFTLHIVDVSAALTEHVRL